MQADPEFENPFEELLPNIEKPISFFAVLADHGIILSGSEAAKRVWRKSVTPESDIDLYVPATQPAAVDIMCILSECGVRWDNFLVIMLQDMLQGKARGVTLDLWTIYKLHTIALTSNGSGPSARQLRLHLIQRLRTAIPGKWRAISQFVNRLLSDDLHNQMLDIWEMKTTNIAKPFRQRHLSDNTLIREFLKSFEQQQDVSKAFHQTMECYFWTYETGPSPFYTHVPSTNIFI